MSENPTTGRTLGRFPSATRDELDARLATAAHAARLWRNAPVGERTRLQHGLAEALLDKRDALANLLTREMGKRLVEARAEVDKCAAALHFFADRAPAWLAPQTIDTDPTEQAEIVHEPLGVVLAIMPWNFPLWQLVRVAAPGLMAGNALLHKPAHSVPQTARALQTLIDEAGYPAGVFQTVLAEVADVDWMLADARIAAVSLTGSERAGRSVAARAGAQLKKVVLELGGSDPFIVLDDADLDVAVATAVRTRMQNNGQSCIAGKRFIATRGIYPDFAERFTRAVAGLRVDDPALPDTDVGPLATAAGRERLAAQVEELVQAGARVSCGGHRVPGPGFFYQPTVLTDVPLDSPAAREELFGPVATLFAVDDAAQALARANDNPFGLGATVFTRDRDRARALSAALEVGMVFVNGLCASDPRFPFGGRKHSGIGRELGREGLFELTATKTVRMRF